MQLGNTWAPLSWPLEVCGRQRSVLLALSGRMADGTCVGFHRPLAAEEPQSNSAFGLAFVDIASAVYVYVFVYMWTLVTPVLP